MSRRIIITTAVVIALLLVVAGISMAAGRSPTPQQTAISSAATRTPSSGATTGGTTYEVGNAGTVTVAANGDVLSVTATTATDGWTARVDHAQGREVEVRFTNGTRGVEFDAELVNGEVVVDIDHDDDGDRAGRTNATCDCDGRDDTACARDRRDAGDDCDGQDRDQDHRSRREPEARSGHHHGDD